MISNEYLIVRGSIAYTNCLRFKIARIAHAAIQNYSSPFPPAAKEHPCKRRGYEYNRGGCHDNYDDQRGMAPFVGGKGDERVVARGCRGL